MCENSLPQSITSKIDCPLCFQFSPAIKEKLGDTEQQERNDVEDEEEFTDATDVTSALHQDIRDIKQILIKQIVPNTNKINEMGEKVATKMHETLDGTWRGQTQAWSDLFMDKQQESQRSIEQTIAKKQQETQKSLEQSITVAQKKVVTEAIDTSREKMERDNVEREKRKRNCVIRDLPESREDTSEAKMLEDKETVSTIMNIDPVDVIDVDRAGIAKSGVNRPVIITLSSPELASEMHNYGRGRRKVNLADEDEFYWINPDLIQTDRLANYRARKEAKEWRENRASRSSTQRVHHHASSPPRNTTRDYTGPPTQVNSPPFRG